MHNKAWESPSWKSVFLIDAHLGKIQVRFICAWQPLGSVTAHQLCEEGLLDQDTNGLSCGVRPRGFSILLALLTPKEQCSQAFN